VRLFCSLALGIAVALPSVASPRALVAQSPGAAASLAPYRHRLLGVFDGQTGEPIEGAQVTDALNKVSALTTKTGTVTLAFLPDGGSLVRIQKLGYEPATILAAISPSDTVPLTVVLTAVARTLPTVVTTDSSPRYRSPTLREFEERRRSGAGGHFVSEAELRKHDNQKMTSLIRTFPGLRVNCSRTGVTACFATSTRQVSKLALSGGPCRPDIYMDGVPSPDDDLERLNVDQFAGVEYYAGGASIPAKYNRVGSSCGVILLWTRER
jgi:hypothetical protein